MDERKSIKKFCPKCEKLLMKTMFGVHNGRPDKLQAYCRPCHRVDQRRYMTKIRAAARSIKR